MPDNPIFISTDAEAILSECIAEYETIAGRTLQPAQPERLVINMFAYRELLIRQQIQAATQQMLIAFAVAPALDYLAELVGVVRLPAVGAACVLSFDLVSGHGGVTIPANTRVITSDGKVVFATVSDTLVLSGVDNVEVEAFAESLGTAGNGYAAGTVNTMLDPLAFVSMVENLAETAGGADAETDEDLRARVKIAPAAFSVAGPKNAYIYFAKSASPAIIDVSVQQIEPGTVGVWPLVAGGVTPTPILNLVTAALNAEDVRPLTDTVLVAAPTVVNYNISVNIQILPGEDADEIEESVMTAVTAYAEGKAGKMGQDIVLTQLIAVAGIIPGVYDVEIDAPGADIIVDVNEVAIAGTIAVEITGTHEP